MKRRGAKRAREEMEIMGKKNRKNREAAQSSVSAEEMTVAKQYGLSVAVIPGARETMRRATRKVRNETPFVAIMADMLWDNDDPANLRCRIFSAAWLATVYARSWNQKRVPEAISRVKALQAKIEELTNRLHELTCCEQPHGNMSGVADRRLSHEEEPLGSVLN